MIRELYDIEDRAKLFSPEERAALRHTASCPVLERIRVALDGDGAGPCSPRASSPRESATSAITGTRSTCSLTRIVQFPTWNLGFGR